MIHIRKFEPADSEAVRYICLNSEGKNKDTEKVNKYVIKTYCDYYIENEPENCFVAADESDVPVGYVVCAEDFESFLSVFKKKYVPSVVKLGPARLIMAMKSIRLHRKHCREYPAHLHIDILPGHQRQGIGGSLIDELCGALMQKNVRGVMLVVASENKQGIAFYNKCGFTMLEKSGEEIAFGLKL